MKTILCPICGGNKFDTLFYGKDRLHKVNNTQFRVVRCMSCCLVLLNPQPTEIELREYYPSTYGPYQDSESMFYQNDFYKTIKSRFLGKKINKQKLDEHNCHTNKTDISSTYLDFGCGGGSHLERMRTKYPLWQFYGLDNNPIACKNTEAKGFTVFYEEDIRKVNLPEGYFDIVNMSHVIEHLNDPITTLQMIYNTMKHRGKFIVSTPNVDSFAAKFFGSFWYALDIPRHVFLFNPKTICALLENSGFKVNKIEFDPGPKVFIRSLYYLLGIKNMKLNPIIYRLFLPFSKIVARLGKSSIMTVYAEKI